MPETITVVGNAPFPDIPLGRAVEVVRTPRIDGLLASGRITRVDAPVDDADVELPTTIDATREWIGDDPARAQVALDVELARTPGPRPTLVSWLEALIADQEAPDRLSGPDGPSGTDATGQDAAALSGDLVEPG